MGDFLEARGCTSHRLRMMNQEKPLISVIIPIYNVEEYLPRCIDSVLSQTYENLEIWLVDDGSTDGSGRICDEYAARDGRIRVIHQDNKGLSEARNAALDRMSGDYIAFVDSDDFIRTDMMSALYADITANDADVAICEIVSGEADIFPTVPEGSGCETFDREEAFKALFDDRYKNAMIPAWNKLYKRKVFEGLRYRPGKIHEDEFLIHHLIAKCDRLIFDTGAYYYHFVRKSSITNSAYSLDNLQAVEAVDERCAFFEELGYRKLTSLCYRDYLRRVQFHYYSLQKYFPERAQERETILRNYRKRYESIKSDLTPGERTRYGLFLKMPGLNGWIKSVMGARKI